jgi:hypothetical protein
MPLPALAVLANHNAGAGIKVMVWLAFQKVAAGAVQAVQAVRQIRSRYRDRHSCSRELLTAGKVSQVRGLILFSSV